MSGGEVVRVEDVIELQECFEVRVEEIAGSDVGNAIGRRTSGAEIVGTIGLMLVVLVATSIGTGGRDDIEIDEPFLGRFIVCKDLEEVLRDLRNTIPRSDLDIALGSGQTGETVVIGAVVRSVDGLGRLIRRVQERVTTPESKMRQLTA